MIIGFLVVAFGAAKTGVVIGFSFAKTLVITGVSSLKAFHSNTPIWKIATAKM